MKTSLAAVLGLPGTGAACFACHWSQL